MIYKPKNFELFELLPCWHYNRWKKYNDLPWLMFPGEVLLQIQMFRNRFGPAYINNWHDGGDNQYRGYRPLNCEIGAKFSLHKAAMAFDMSFRDHTADEVREDILRHQNASWCKYVHAIEMGVPWLHWDMRNIGIPDEPHRIQIINPLKQ